jgi:hypothetical protein
MKHRLSAVFLLVVLVFQSLAQQPQAAPTISIERLRSDVAYLASDALQGRRTGTKGNNLAAEYLKNAFRKIGLEPAGTPPAKGKPPRYEQPFPYVAGVALGRKNSLRYAIWRGSSLSFGLETRVGKDWLPMAFSSNGKLEGVSAVFAGYGISDQSLNRDDYAGLDVKDKVAIVFAGAPEGVPTTRASDARAKAINARQHGAKACVIIANEEKFADDRLAKLSYDNAGEAGLPVMAVSREVAVVWLAGGHAERLADLQQKAKTQNPRDIVLDTGAVSLSATVDLTRNTVKANNIIGVLPGNDPNLKNEAIVIGAHYDHLGLGGEGSGSLAPKAGDIHHGADDNASGTAGLLELARLFAAEKRNRRTLIFIAFSGEEEGLLGSNFYVNNPAWPLDKTVAMINMDMIGRMRDKKMTVGGIGTAQEFRPLIEQLNSQTPVAVTNAKRFDLALSEDGFGPSDHSSFYAKQIPVLFFFTGAHEDYHKPSDTAEKINYEDEARILQMVSEALKAIDGNDKRPTYAVAKASGEGRRSPTFNVTLGVIPGYAESSDGMKLDGVREGSPADKAGLKAGDKVTKLGGFDIKNVQDYTYALGQLKANVEYEVVVTRGGETLTLKITPAARKQ